MLEYSKLLHLRSEWITNRRHNISYKFSKIYISHILVLNKITYVVEEVVFQRALEDVFTEEVGFQRAIEDVLKKRNYKYYNIPPTWIWMDCGLRKFKEQHSPGKYNILGQLRQCNYFGLWNAIGSFKITIYDTRARTDPLYGWDVNFKFDFQR